MHTFDYKDHAVTLAAAFFVGGLEEWVFSITTPQGATFRSPAHQTFSSHLAAATAARKWIDEHSERAN